MARLLIPIFAALCLHPGGWLGVPAVPSWAALLLGIAVALSFGNPFPPARMAKVTRRLLAYSVVGLGAGMNLAQVATVGLHGVAYTFLSLSVALAAGIWLGRRLGVEGDTALLIAVGTAICGGSAIAAAAPTLRARDHEVTIALATVFLLNACALLVFPPIGHAAGLGEEAFGLWSALAIHDTSSVVGAALAYGGHSVEIATTVKLARALWIVPLTLVIGAWVTRTRPPCGERPTARRPWFILGFLVAAALATYVPVLTTPGRLLADAAKRVLVVTLFLIGTGLSRAALKSVGVRPLVHGFVLWAFMASTTLLLIVEGVIE